MVSNYKALNRARTLIMVTGTSGSLTHQAAAVTLMVN